jgi:hypothetical protein
MARGSVLVDDRKAGCRRQSESHATFAPLEPDESVQMVPRRPAEEVQLPFKMELARPRKMRLDSLLTIRPQKANARQHSGGAGWSDRRLCQQGYKNRIREVTLDLSTIQECPELPA